VHVAEALGGAAEGGYEQEAAAVEEGEEMEREDERGMAKCRFRRRRRWCRRRWCHRGGGAEAGAGGSGRRRHNPEVMAKGSNSNLPLGFLGCTTSMAKERRHGTSLPPPRPLRSYLRSYLRLDYGSLVGGVSEWQWRRAREQRGAHQGLGAAVGIATRGTRASMRSLL
jgi:hypothetical protein